MRLVCRILLLLYISLSVYLTGDLRAETEMPQMDNKTVNSAGTSDNKSDVTEKTMYNQEDPPVVDIAALNKLSQVVESVRDKRIIYVGENHTDYAHHNVQLEVIKALYNKGGKLAIGMEMFQRPFQKALDDYMAGNINEKEFLKRSEYFKRWKYDYNLYKPILDFAREKKIPAIALNQKKEIVDKVSRQGIDNLTAEEKKAIPAQIDLTDKDYRDRLKEVFSLHAKGNIGNFDYFLQAQVLWDETMSQAIDDYFRGNPELMKDGQMVVLAGGGHLAFGSGIPKRTYRRNGYSYSILLNDYDIEKDVADYIVMPKHTDGKASPKLMAMLKETDNNSLVVTGFTHGSVSEKAGLRKGDEILAMDGSEIHDMEDLMLELFFKKSDDVAKLKVKRRFLFWHIDTEIDVRL